MIFLPDILDMQLLDEMVKSRYVSYSYHPHENTAILNYTRSCQYDRVWNDVTEQCRGLIYDVETGLVRARPWRKFYNYGETDFAPSLDSRVQALDKLDGSLGILYRRLDGAFGIASRGSFTSDQALKGTEMLDRVFQTSSWEPAEGFTYLFEIIYPENRIVVDYEGKYMLVLLDVLETDTGQQAFDYEWTYPGPWAERYGWEETTLGDVLKLEPRPNAEGLVLTFEDGKMLKLKQDDYVELHRIVTGLNARNIWEVQAVQHCHTYIDEPRHWGSFLGISSVRASECLALSEDWLENLPDEFYEWVTSVMNAVSMEVSLLYDTALGIVYDARSIVKRTERFFFVQAECARVDLRATTEVMRLASALRVNKEKHEQRLYMKCWKLAEPKPTSLFTGSEDTA